MSNKWVKRISRALLPCFVFFVFSFSFSPKVYAADAEVVVAYGLYCDFGGYDTPRTYVTTANSPVINGGYKLPYGGTYIGDFVCYTNNDTLFYDNVKVYCSYYYQRGSSSDSCTPLVGFDDVSNWAVTYTNDFGTTGEVLGGLDEFSVIGGNSSSMTNSTYVIEANFTGSEIHSLRALDVRRIDPTTGFRINNQSGNVNIIVPSLRVITTAYSAEMEALDKVADEIAAQSDILLAMKGDLVAILQDIYTMTGDMYIAQNLLNGYVQQMLPLLQNINTTTANIYSLLSTQLRLLETAIENAADSVEAAISAQTAAMIAYLEQYFNTGNEVPDDTYQQQQDASNILDQMESLEKPNVDNIVPEIGDYTDSGVSGVLSAIFSSNLIVTMMTLSASFAFGAYVLFGKRE